MCMIVSQAIFGANENSFRAGICVKNDKFNGRISAMMMVYCSGCLMFYPNVLSEKNMVIQIKGVIPFQAA